MSIVRNAALAQLRRGETSLGFSVGLVKSVAVAQLAATAGYHWLAIDMEHSPLTIAEASAICLAALPVGVTPIVRVKMDALDEGARALDCGAQGVLVPNVATEADARRVVDYLRYPPHGSRSWGAAASHFAYAPPPLAQALAEINGETLLAAMIETGEGLGNVEAIAAAEGIDVVFVGASDLSIDLGVAGDFAGTVMQDAFARVAAACRASGKAMGVGGVYDETLTSRLIGLGARFLAGGSDQAFMQSAATAQAKFLAGLAAGAGAA